MVGLYFLIAFMVAFPYFSWKYANVHGFWSWLFLGEVVQAGKAMIWPYYLLPDRDPIATPEQRAAYEKHVAIVELSNETTRHLVAGRWAEAAKSARAVAALIDTADAVSLASFNPEWPDRLACVRADYLALAKSLDADDQAGAMRARQSIVAFQEWEEKHVPRSIRLR